MPLRKRYHLVPDGKDWKLEVEGAQRATRRFDKKKKGLKASPGIARGSEPSQLIVHRQDGTIQEERTYGGKDPYPPEG